MTQDHGSSKLEFAPVGGGVPIEVLVILCEPLEVGGRPPLGLRPVEVFGRASADERDHPPRVKVLEKSGDLPHSRLLSCRADALSAYAGTTASALPRSRPVADAAGALGK